MMNEVDHETGSQPKPYPRRCGECGQVAVVAETMAYEAEIKYDGKLQRIRIPQLPVDRCGECGEELAHSCQDVSRPEGQVG